MHNSAILRHSTDSISSPIYDTLALDTPQRDGEPYTVITPMEPVARMIRSGSGPWLTTPHNSRNQSFHAVEEHALANATGLSPPDGHSVPRYRSRQTLGGTWNENRDSENVQGYPSTLHPYVSKFLFFKTHILISSPQVTNYTSPIGMQFQLIS
jgi:hypothetical protein